MDPKERNALDKCFQGFLRDLDPSVSFVHSLYADRVITEAQAEQINSNALRETKVTLLMKFLPQRGS
ncbi:hypothetical protein MAR_032344 [Mya arenaria]|uniref:CARD domain-containing protein n=1 Tax=Mya arenaria TaxID=6604 RepID=A0ABY7F6C2_MYAAR|nr:hypothetical protein MAR_032344 [Mya arenaria]